VVTQPDRPRGRGKQLSPSPVKQWALEHGLPFLQPARLKEGSFLRQVEAIAPDLIAVVAYGMILPPSSCSCRPWDASTFMPRSCPPTAARPPSSGP